MTNIIKKYEDMTLEELENQKEKLEKIIFDKKYQIPKKLLQIPPELKPLENVLERYHRDIRRDGIFNKYRNFPNQVYEVLMNCLYGDEYFVWLNNVKSNHK